MFILISLGLGYPFQFIIFVLILKDRGMLEGSNPSFFVFIQYQLRPIALIQISTIRQLAEAHLEGTAGFLVDVRVGEKNAISILLDNDDSTSINQCMALSRYLEDALDRDAEDFVLDVSSPGLDQPLQTVRQYEKNIGRGVQVKLQNAGKMEGELTAVTESAITIKTREKQRIEGRKAKEWVEEEKTFELSDLDWTKVQISFKKN
jgi:ribosome maturation factor RimP